MAAPMGAGNLGGVGDARLSVDVDDIGTRHDSIIHQVGPPDTHGHNTIYLDSSITFETYHWWAQRAREFEKDIPANAGYTGFFEVLVGRMKKEKTQLPGDRNDASGAEPTNEKERAAEIGSESPREDSEQKATDSPSTRSTKEKYGVTPAEWEQAQRAGRTASWGAIFYLITTDILGPFSIPWAIAVGQSFCAKDGRTNCSRVSAIGLRTRDCHLHRLWRLSLLLCDATLEDVHWT